MKDICYLNVDYHPSITENSENETVSGYFQRSPPSIYAFKNVTNELLATLNQLFNIDLFTNYKIDLNLLRIFLCYHHETCCIMFLLMFLIQRIISCSGELISRRQHCPSTKLLSSITNYRRWFQKNSKSFKMNDKTLDKHKDNIDGLNDCNHNLNGKKLQSTIYFRLKKILAALIFFVYLIEISIILLLYEYDIFGDGLPYFFTNVCSFMSSLSIFHCMFNKKNNRRHQNFICLYWLLSLMNIIWNVSSFYLTIMDGEYSFWKLCSTCYWNMDNIPHFNDEPFHHSKSPPPSSSSSSFFAVNFRQIIIDLEDEETMNKFGQYSFHFNCIYLSLFSIQFILAFLPDFQTKRQLSTKLAEPDHYESFEKNNFNPEPEATLFGQLFFVWISSTIFRGYRRPLSVKNIFQTAIPVEQMERQLSDSLMNKKAATNHYTNKSGQINLVKILLTQFGLEFLQIASIKLIPTLITFLGPLLLDRLIRFATLENSNQPQWHGYVYVISMFLLFLNETILNSYSDYRLMVLALKIRASLTASIYRRLLQTSNSRRYHSSGQIINIMSTDTQRIFEYIKIVNLFWICPLQIIIAIIMLWQHLAYGSLACLGVLLFLLPFNTFIGTRIRSLQSKLLQYKDGRIKALNETLAGIRALKLYAWEEYFQKRIETSRRMEIRNLRIQALYSAAITFVFTSAPFFIAFASFALFIYINNNSVHLDARKAFVSLAIFNIIRRPLAFFPQLITNSMMFLVSLKRISEILDEPISMLSNSKTFENFESPPRICLRNCAFSWCVENENDQQQCFQLNKIDLDIQNPGLFVIVGGNGSGKSSLLSAVLRQMNIIDQKDLSIFNVKGKIAYVPQNSWIQSGTIRENILFGSKFDSVRYWRVIEACALLDDLKQMSDGDKTLVGEKGYNLSGGQRQRIALARAVYSDADLYLLDDTLSALDSQVSKHIFNKVLGNRSLLSNKIRLLVTHNMALLPYSDQIILLENGTLAAQGNYLELIQEENKFTDFLTTYFSTNPKNQPFEDDDDGLVVEEDDYEILVEMADRLEKQFSSFSRRGSVRRKISITNNNEHLKKRNKFNIFKLHKNQKIKPEKESKHLEYNETCSTTKTGSISLQVYWDYIRAIGLIRLTTILLCYIFGHSFVLLTNLWLSSWSSDGYHVTDNSTTTTDTKTELLMNSVLMKMGLIEHSTGRINQWLRLNVYAFLGMGQTIFILAATLLLNFSCLRGSQSLHSSMLNRIMRAPIWFFDQATSGQILNRFNKDIDVADTTLISTLRLFMIEVFRAMALFTIIGLGTDSPLIIVCFIPLMIVYCFIYKYYVRTSRQLIRLESMLRTPIYLQFNETYTGVSVIQAFQMMDLFLKKIYQRIDMNSSAYHMNIAASRWLNVRLECIGNLVVLITTLSCVWLRGHITPGMVGLCINCSLNITGTLNLLIRSSIDLENNIVTVERLVDYTRLPQEDKCHPTIKPTTNNIKRPSNRICHSLMNFIKIFLNIKQNKGLAHQDSLKEVCIDGKRWMVNGSISFQRYSSRYQNSLSFCLKDINLTIDSGTKVGIVGRTGAGKSSFAMALFRIIESETGNIFISDRNISEIDLHELRSSLTIIPQEPLLFTGTLRDNLDPFQQYSDQQILEALNKAHLGDVACSTIKLNQTMDLLLNRLSFGQKQLFCLARALLCKPKVLVLDEATAGIDPATDLLVQETIRREFGHCTVLTIAHRLKTVLNYDRILVLDQGQVMEFDSPQTLISDQSSLFYKMIYQ